MTFFLRFESDCVTTKFNNSLSRFDGYSTIRFTVYLGVYSVHGIQVDASSRVSAFHYIRLTLYVGF